MRKQPKIDWEYMNEILASQVATEQESEDLTTLSFIAYNFPYWKRCYLKRNQPKNYFRITMIIPDSGDAIDHPSIWICKFQVWVKGKILNDHRITADTFDTISKHWSGWVENSDNLMTAFYYRPQIQTDTNGKAKTT